MTTGSITASGAGVAGEGVFSNLSANMSFGRSWRLVINFLRFVSDALIPLGF